MGVVYEAEDLELDRHVAVKFLPAELAQDEQALNRFRREARAASALNHPHICTIHEIGEHEGQPFLILELLAGETLGKRIERGPLPIHDVVRFGAHLADALDIAHSAGIVHRDIKPANLFITERGDLKVLDFGLAKREAAGSIDDATSAPTMRASDGPLTSPGTTMGTVHYMSPEQVRAENLDARTDIFSAGIVIYQMATGKLPFDGSSPGVIFAAILSAQPEPPSSINREVSEAFEGVIGRALAKERSDRYQSALELMAGLAEMPISADSWITTVPPGTRAPAAPFQATAELDKPDSSISAPHARWLWVALAVVGALAVGSAWMNFRSDAELDVQRALPAVRPEQRVVVLPFENLGNPDNQYFASGVANEIISRLGSIGGLKVISHSAARQYAGTGKTLREIGEELEATHAVTGSVLWVEDDGVSRVRISPELIRIADDSQLWGDTIDQEVEDIFQVQGMIAEQIAANLGIELSETQKEILGAELTSSSQAYQAFLRGQAERVGLAEGSYVRAIALFEIAVKLDPEFAEAWAELSRNKGHAHRMGFITDPTIPEQVRSDADRAVSLRPESTVAQAALGWYYYEIEGDYQRAAEIWEQIARRHPNDVGAARDLGAAYRRLGRTEDSGQEFARALRLEPNQPDILLNYGWTLAGLRRWDEATELFNKGVEIAPEIVEFYESLAHLTIASGGTLEDAKQLLAQAPGDTRAELMTVHWYERDYPSVLADLQQLPVDPRVLTRLGILHRRMGKPDEARAYFEQAKAMLEAMMPGRVINEDQAAYAPLLAWAQAGLGNVEEAVRIADKTLTFRPHDLFSRPRYVIDGAAKAYAWAGETERALDVIEEALSTPVQLGSGWRFGVSGPGFRLNPDWDELRGNPRFEALVDRLEAAN